MQSSSRLLPFLRMSKASQENRVWPSFGFIPLLHQTSPSQCPNYHCSTAWTATFLGTWSGYLSMISKTPQVTPNFSCRMDCPKQQDYSMSPSRDCTFSQSSTAAYYCFIRPCYSLRYRYGRPNEVICPPGLSPWQPTVRLSADLWLYDSWTMQTLLETQFNSRLGLLMMFSTNTIAHSEVNLDLSLTRLGEVFCTVR